MYNLISPLLHIIQCIGMVISGICDFFVVCLCVCLCVHALKGKRLELLMPNLVDIHVQCIACQLLGMH